MIRYEPAGAFLLLWAFCLPVAADPVAVSPKLDAEQQIERLEQMAAEHADRLEELQDKAESLPTEDQIGLRQQRVRRVVAELMSDAEFRDSLFPAAVGAGFDRKRGFYLDSADETFSLNVKGYLQVKYTGLNRQTDNRRVPGRQKIDDQSGVEIERLFLAFYGHIHTPKLKYRIVADAGYTGVGGGGAEDGEWMTYYAHVDYEYVTGHYITAGLIRLPFGVQSKTSASVLQFTDRSMVSWAHWVDRSVGLMAHGNLLEKRLTYFASITNGAFNADDSPSQEELDTNFAYIARLCYYALGRGDSLTESRAGYPQSDLAFSKDPVLRFGGSILINDNNGDAGNGSPPGLWAEIPDSIRRGRGIGGTQLIDDTGTEYVFLEFDSGFRYRGFSVNVEYFVRSIDGESEYSQWELRTGRDDTVHQQAGNLQIGYFVIPKRLEIAGRMGGIWDTGNDAVWEWGVGVNYFPWGTYNCRLAADFIRISEVMGGVASGPSYGLNDEVSMIRLLMQVGF